MKGEWFFIISCHNVNLYRFDFLTCVLVLFDCIIVPMKNSFGLDFLSQDSKDRLHFLENVITAIFMLDVILGFCCTYIDERTGQHETSLKLIAIRYLKFYFWVDLLGCMPFDLFTDLATLRSLSLLKIVRMFRFQKLLHFIGVGSEIRSQLRIIQIIITMLIFIHCATCYFYVIVTENYNV